MFLFFWILRLFCFFLLGDDKKDKVPAAVAKTTKSDTASKPPTTPTKANKTSAAQSAPVAPLGVNLEKVDLGKISSILSSLTSVMKNTGMFRGLMEECNNDKNIQLKDSEIVQLCHYGPLHEWHVNILCNMA